MKTITALAAALGLAFTMPGFAQDPTPRGTALTHEIDNEEYLALFVALPTSDPNVRLGVGIVCPKTERKIELYFSFGAFPRNKAVQAAIRTPNGEVLRLGPAVRAPGPSAGYHDPIVTDPALVEPALAAVLTKGTLISNGHNSVWLELPVEVAASVRRRMDECVAGAG